MNQPLSGQLAEDVQKLKDMFGNSVDLYTKKIQLLGVNCCLCMFESLSSMNQMWALQLSQLEIKTACQSNSMALLEYIQKKLNLPIENSFAEDFEQAGQMLTAGMALLLIEGSARALAFSSQSMIFRSIQEPSGEGDIRGSREGFGELLRVNISLVRRLVRTQGLTIKTFQLGERTQTEVAVMYDRKIADMHFVQRTIERLQNIKIPVLFDTGYLAPFLHHRGSSFFQDVGYTERPVTAAAKICEGKLVLLVNGSPFAMVLPFFFSENFQSLDDYASKAYFASFIRILKYTAFFLAVLLPGVFVSIAGYTPELLPPQLLYKVASAEAATPLPLFLEMVLVIILLEIIREAGLRLPKPIGHTVGLVAALIVGDTAVKTGILSTPVVIVAALTTISMQVIPSLYEPGTVLRVLFVFAGGVFGPLGILTLFFGMLISICGMNNFGLPYTSPLLPFGMGAMRDGILRLSWRVLARKPFQIQDLPGAGENQDEK